MPPISPKDLLQKNDEDLVKLTLENQELYLYLMRRYEPKLLRYILRISNVSEAEAEDVLQDVFIKAFQHLNEFDPDLKFSSWIYRITRNQVISNYRKIKARPQTVELIEEAGTGVEKLLSDLDIEEALNNHELALEVEKVLTAMDQKYKEVLVLKYLEDKSYQEISDILKKPLGTVATLLNRAKQAFKKQATVQGVNFALVEA
ncbi:MAG: hypothetical protein A2445_01595 [Candidatus Jacksonbacteria bacterium RIFOXYC2_FULL_44_29]|nr:MAG: RNA polymerase, sigma-24 subunit, ECF subfamily [Parcubacteria group bacterium GW2011_GWC2_44_22]OGY75070.1 MAG: hypothetical protein A2240_00685 [Candidatus Jacksonbacteria bacterium RIFOXYA2_FULL_43_12]OGY77545.1 MAG: hypothetical protein A2295_05365 [Candidatus Jacksonbacteria bacterium RIFOXYB2_FULL_44_15]OGY79965.1 MAG: hypothetical protein A2550_05500 [Candidatus Jacksonbacteria bacterium RIFOXYD2_FULL_43_21]OGY80347.1 MAG: hypothetical protein A2445_01595 [Candidatus Jacksonbacte